MNDSPEPTIGPPRPRRRRLRRAAITTLAVLLVALIAGRLYLPFYVQSFVNRVLDESPDYGGSVGSVHVSLWRGAYSIDDVKVVKRTHSIPVPLFESRRVDCSLDWGSLLHGVARARVRLDHPRLNFVHGPSTEDTQTGADQPWLSIIDDLSPFRLDKADIVDGEIHFHAFHTNPQVHVYLSDIQASISNLTNLQNLTDPLMASLHARGAAMESGRFECDMSLEPRSHQPHFDLAARLLDLDVTKLNSLARAYGDFDFEGGRFDLVVEASAKDGFVEGYTKPLFRNVTVLSIRDVRKDDPLQLLWESLVGAAGAIFKNQARDQFGTRIALYGELDNPRTSILEAVGNVLRNAFVRAYLPRLEGRTAADVTARSDRIIKGDNHERP